MIKIASAHGFTTQELHKLQAAIDLANRVMPLDQFKAAILAFRFDSTNDSSVEIYQRLTAQDWAVDFCIVTPPWYKRWFSKEVAHESSNGVVTLDRNKFVNEDLPSLANTAFHETCHKAGYHHASAKDYFSVPYGAGNILEKIARQMGDVLSAAQDIGMNLIKAAKVAEEVQA